MESRKSLDFSHLDTLFGIKSVSFCDFPGFYSNMTLVWSTRFGFLWIFSFLACKLYVFWWISMNFHHFDTLLVIKLCLFAFSVFLGESYHVLPDPGLGNCNYVSCDLHEFYMFCLMVALLAKPRSKIFLHPSAFPVPHCRFPCPDPGNVEFTSVYDRFWGIVFCGFAVPET